jgi:hypothetical protein
LVKVEVAPLRLSVKWVGVLQLGCLTVDAQIGEMSKTDSGEMQAGFIERVDLNPVIRDVSGQERAQTDVL